jgi:AcrR family transcriptional regulator
MTRPYRMKIRAERQADTHRRILEAATRLHRTRGLDRTTISDIARMAGVEPPTVTRHFPDRASLVIACLTPGLEQDPPPRPDAWAEIADPEARLAWALTAVYRHYRRNRVFLSVLADETNAEFAPAHEAARPMRAHAHAVLAEGWPVSESARPRLLTAIAHAFSFWAWVSMADLGLSEDAAAALMLDMVRGVVNSLNPNQVPRRQD